MTETSGLGRDHEHSIPPPPLRLDARGTRAGGKVKAPSPTTRAVERALDQMRTDGIIIQFDTHFDDRDVWRGPQVTVWIASQDEVSVVRAKKWIQERLSTVLPDEVTVAVYPDAIAGMRL